MNKKALVDKVASKTGQTKKVSEIVIDALFETIQEGLASGEEIAIQGFGKFLVRERAARKARNPQTGEEVLIPAVKVPAFKAGKILKDAVKHL